VISNDGWSYTIVSALSPNLEMHGMEQLCSRCGQPLWPFYICPRCEYQRSPRLVHPAKIRQNRLIAYYDEFNQHPPFVQDLRGLACLIAGTPMPDMGYLFRAVGVEHPQWEMRPNLGAYEELPAAFRSMLSDFVDRWRLPRKRHPDDRRPERFADRQVWDSLAPVLTGLPPNEVRLTVSGLEYFEPQTSVAISIPGVGSFIYIPTEHPPAAVRSLARAAPPGDRAGIFYAARTAERHARDAGWRRIANRYRHKGELQREAHRVFQYVVLDKSLSEILVHELRSLHDNERAACSWQAIGAVIKEWSDDLGIPLPRRQGGRPSKSTFKSQK
jgi:hypothetical protein